MSKLYDNSIVAALIYVYIGEFPHVIHGALTLVIIWGFGFHSGPISLYLVEQMRRW